MKRSIPFFRLVEKMRLFKGKSSLANNEFLMLEEIPPEMFEYCIRSALKWVVDQYQVSTDKRSGITNVQNVGSTPHPNPLPVRGGEGTDPNRPDDPESIFRLSGQVITVSLETVKVANGWQALEKADTP